VAVDLSISNPQSIFAAVALLIFVGFVGNLIFSRLRFNDTLLLIALGVVLGPLTGIIPPAQLAAASGIIGPLALILILFDGGLALKLREILGGLGGAAILGILGFILTAGLVGGVVTATLVDVPEATLQTRFLIGLILGSILGGTSALVVMPSLQNIRCEPKTSTTLGLESALTDILVVVVTFTLLNVVAGTIDEGGSPSLDAQNLTSTLLITFAMAIFLGVAVGILWLFVLPGVREKPFGYMLTLGAMFALYVLVEWLLRDVSSGGGPLAVLAFGIILGNHMSLGSFGKRIGEDFGPGIKRFQAEISFLVRTFFFLYLGILVDLELLKSAYIWAVGILVFAALLLARYIAVTAATRRIRMRGDDWILLSMMPRGLAAAVLAALPASAAYNIPGTQHFVAIAFLILVLTNLASTLGALILEKQQRGSGHELASKTSSAGAAASRTGSGSRAPRASRSPPRAPRAPRKKTG
jgi:potassium/hydrogen antiporter